MFIFDDDYDTEEEAIEAMKETIARWKPGSRPRISVQQLRDALYQAYYHNELDELAGHIEAHYIDSNDHPLLEAAAKAIIARLDR